VGDGRGEKGQKGRRPLWREKAKPLDLEDPRVEVIYLCKEADYEQYKGNLLREKLKG
jgi:hypothetical protein